MEQALTLAQRPPLGSAGAATLPLRPLLAATAYEATLSWETYANGTYQLSTIRKEVALRVQSNAAGYVLDFQITSPPTLTRAEDLEPLEKIALHLAALYGRVVVQADATGEVTGLLNHEALLQTWDRLSQEMRAATLPDNQVLETMLGFLAQQLQSPAGFLQSLQHDYLYQTLLPNVYNQPLSGAAPRWRQFSNFFDKVSLWFAEQAEALPTEPPTLRLHGSLDAQRTDVAQVTALISNQLHLAPAPVAMPPLPAVIPAPHFQYEAMYTLAPATNLPAHVELTVYARAGELYNKQYTLTLTCL